MTYTSGGLIQAADYNTFTTNSGGLNDIWGAGSGDKGWGQTAFTAASAGTNVTATQWATLVNNLASAGSQTSSTITSRSAPTTGTLISVLAAVATDITTVTNNRGNAAASGSQVTTSGSSAAGAKATNSAGWTITFTQTITYASAAAARYFFNAGGIVRVAYSKSSTGTDKDPDWNTLAGQCGTINFTGRVRNTVQSIAGTIYTGTTRLNGTGGTQTTLATTTGFYNLVAGAAATTLFQLNDAVSPYTADYIRTTVALDATSTVLTFVTTWVDAGYSGAGKNNAISAGATTALSYFPPSTTYLTASWGTPTLASSVA